MTLTIDISDDLYAAVAVDAWKQGCNPQDIVMEQLCGKYAAVLKTTGPANSLPSRPSLSGDKSQEAAYRKQVEMQP